MRSYIIVIFILTLTSCKDGFNYETKAAYQAEVSNLRVNLIASGYILHGHDLDNDGLITGKITSPKLSDSISFVANQDTFLSISYNQNFLKKDDLKNREITLMQFLNIIGFIDYNTEEVFEFENVIKSTAYGPKGTYMKNQPELIKVISVDFNTF